MNKSHGYLFVVIGTLIIGLGQIADLFIRTSSYFVNVDSPWYVVIASTLFDRLALIGFLVLALFILFREYRRVLADLVRANDKIEEQNLTLQSLASVPENIHYFHHHLRDAVDAIDRGRGMGDAGRKQALAEWDKCVQKALLHVTKVFEGVRPGQYTACIKIIGTYDEKTKTLFGITSKRSELIKATGADAFRIVTAARDEKSRPNKKIIDKFGLSEGYNKMADNRLYSDLFHSDTVPWCKYFNSFEERLSDPLYGGDRLPRVWNEFSGMNAPESTLYCSICITLDNVDEKSITSAPTIAETVARSVDVNGVLYVDCEEGAAFGAESEELAYSFADALYKVMEYKQKYVTRKI